MDNLNFIKEYIALLEKALEETNGIVPLIPGSDKHFRVAKDKANYYCGYNSDVLASVSRNARETIENSKNKPIEKLFTEDDIPF